jgi:hypothetical protein
MGSPIHKLPRTALGILIAWLLAFQPMVAAHAAAAMAGQAPLAMELCRGGPATDQGVPASSDRSAECCLACAPTPAEPSGNAAEIAVPANFWAAPAPKLHTVSLATAGLGPQSARAPPL